MKTILNAEQYSKWEETQEKMAHRKKGMRKGEGPKHGERTPK
jgi:hypothetical protein